MTPLRLAVNLSNADWVSRSPSGELQGLAILVGARLAEMMDHEPKFIEFPSAGPLVSADARDAWDVAFLARDKARENLFHFTDPLFSADGVLLTRRSDQNTALDAFGAGEIGVSSGSAIDGHLARLSAPSLTGYATVEEALDALRAGRIRAVAAPTKAFKRFIAENSDYVLAGEPFMRIDQACAVPRRLKALADDVSRLIPIIKSRADVAAAIERPWLP